MPKIFNVLEDFELLAVFVDATAISFALFEVIVAGLGPLLPPPPPQADNTNSATALVIICFKYCMFSLGIPFKGKGLNFKLRRTIASYEFEKSVTVKAMREYKAGGVLGQFAVVVHVGRGRVDTVQDDRGDMDIAALCGLEY